MSNVRGVSSGMLTFAATRIHVRLVAMLGLCAALVAGHVTLSAAAQEATGDTCHGLGETSQPDIAIKLAETVPAGTFAPVGIPS
jgi:hypothetical protein